jgi:Domain of unknown function (DUF222)/HNH endonuclease
MCRTGQIASAEDAVAAVSAGLSWLADADVTGLTSVEQAACLRGLARAESQAVAARSAVLAGFDASCGYEADAAASARSWLRWQTRITPAAAAGAAGWMRRLRLHPRVAAALAAGEMSPSWARQVCDWTDLLGAGDRDAADQVLLAAAAGGAELADLAGLGEEIRARCARPDADGDDDGFRDRSLRLSEYWQGNGQLTGNLTPECTAAMRAVLDALGTRAGPEDIRSPDQRDHDALLEALQRLLAARCLPDRGGQATVIQLHMGLEQLLGLPGAGQAVADWAGYGATAPPGADCDAAIVPVVTGHLDPVLLDQLAATLLRPDAASSDAASSDAASSDAASLDAVPGTPGAAAAGTAAAELILSRAVRLLSGPAGLAAWLRTTLTAGPAAAISQPLDIGAATEVIPPHLRRAVVLRDRHCGFPGCYRPPAACHVHHIIPRSRGGTTSLANCLLLCSFHHLVAVHRWGWTIRLHPDGTTTATSPDGRKTLHSHSPPAA